MKRLNKLLSAALVALTVFAYAALPASAASLPKLTNLQTYNIDDDEINLKWSKVKGADGYQVYVYNEQTKKWNKIGTTAKTSFEAENLRSAKTYKFRVRAYDKKTSGTDYSAYANIEATTAPDEAENVKATAKTQTAITFKWSAVNGATGYEYRVYDVAQGKYIKKAKTDKTTVKVTGLQKGKSYRFKVRAYTLKDGKYSYGEYSDPLAVKTKGTAAAANDETVITKAKAESVALNHAGLKKSQVKFFECKLDRENGIKVYEVEFDYGKYEYEYEINAQSGKIISVEKNLAD